MEETRLANPDQTALTGYYQGGSEINHLVEQDSGIPVVAKIRLGKREGDKKYPAGKFEHFFLQDPGVGPNKYHQTIIAKYGENPTRLPIRFVTPHMGEMIPSAYKWYRAGSLFKDGTVKAGALVCRGNGPHMDGTPGEARFFGQKDPVTQIVPSRECYGESCPDYRDEAGRQQCKPVMSITFMMPDCVLGGMLVIDTSSKHTMRQVRQQLAWALKIPVLRENWHQVPWVIYRKKVPTRFYNASKKREEEGFAYVVNLEFDEVTFSRMVESGELGRGSAQTAIPQPPKDDFGPEELYEVEPVDDTPDEAEVVLNDPEVVSLFEELEKVTGRQFSSKSRLLAIRGKGSGPQLKERVIEATKRSIMAALANADSNASDSPKPDAPSLPKESVL